MNKVRITRSITGFIGVSMLTFGLLKFVEPFKTWYATQIEMSDMPSLSYALGIAGEIIVGAALLLIFLPAINLSERMKSQITQVSSLAVVVMMAVAIHVHMQPDVPAEVLPLKIRPPFIPGMFAVLAIFNVVLIQKLKVKRS